VLKFRPQTRLDPVRLVSLVGARADLALIPPSGLRLTLDPPAGGGRAAADNRRASPAEGRKGRPGRPAPSWWTVRAREGTVRPGFTKAEVLKPARDDPRAPGGVFVRVGGLLSDLLDQG